MSKDENLFYDVVGGIHEKPAHVEATWRPSVYGVAQNANGDLLVVKPGWNDQWELPGGGVNKGERLLEALKREMLEETGYRVLSISELPVHIGEHRFYLRRSKIFHYTICLSYRVEFSDEPRDTSKMNVELPDEVVEMRWVPLKDFTKENCHPITLPVVEVLKRINSVH
ncbi:NUDIX hydrolase [Candidatus Uhrbacteria bacterium]|nr:NUDIX hydrolase [Candidatus Uhrbacteria bacterium]